MRKSSTDPRVLAIRARYRGAAAHCLSFALGLVLALFLHYVLYRVGLPPASRSSTSPFERYGVGAAGPMPHSGSVPCRVGPRRVDPPIEFASRS